MNIKSLWRLVAAALLGIAAHTAHAQIPVTDVASISNAVAAQAETITKWTQQYTQLQSQLQQAEQMYTSMTGSRGMGALFSSNSLNSVLPADWNSVLSSIKSTPAFTTERKNYPSNPSLPKSNAFYDVVAAQNVSMSQIYSQSSQRLQEVQSLLGQIDSASDPAAKQDLANRLITEHNAINANAQVLSALQQKNLQDLNTASQAATMEWQCKEFQSSGC